MSEISKSLVDCEYPWTGLVIYSNGDVRPCCWFCGTIGNINNETIKEIWNGEKIKTVRKLLSENKIPPDCEKSSCIYIRNMIIGNVK